MFAYIWIRVIVVLMAPMEHGKCHPSGKPHEEIGSFFFKAGRTIVASFYPIEYHISPF
jgi:hypothetical protein